MSRFANGNILSTPSRFIIQCKLNIQNFCLFVIFVSAVMLGAILIGFKTLMTLSIWRCILTHIFFWLNTENNADPYIIKPPSLSSTRKRDNEPEGTLFSWFQRILFLPHQSNVMDHSWPLAMDHICKNKKPCLYVHKRTSTKLSRPSNPSLGKSKSTSFIFVYNSYLLTIFYRLALPKYSSSCQGLL